MEFQTTVGKIHLLGSAIRSPVVSAAASQLVSLNVYPCYEPLALRPMLSVDETS